MNLWSDGRQGEQKWIETLLILELGRFSLEKKN